MNEKGSEKVRLDPFLDQQALLRTKEQTEKSSRRQARAPGPEHGQEGSPFVSAGFELRIVHETGVCVERRAVADSLLKVGIAWAYVSARVWALACTARTVKMAREMLELAEDSEKKSVEVLVEVHVQC